MNELDDPKRVSEIRRAVLGKPALKRFYEEIYARYASCLAECPKHGLVVELGSGAGFAKQLIPELITTDVLPYEGVDQVVDATKMPFRDGSVRFFGMLNVFHHIPDVAAFLAEAERCLAPGGRLLVIDQNKGWISSLILRYLHHEPFRPGAESWQFDSEGPLSGANGALAWIVFVRDRKRFETEFGRLSLLGFQPFAPLFYWLSGGLKKWSLLPRNSWTLAAVLDRTLLRVSDNFGSFVEVEIARR